MKLTMKELEEIEELYGHSGAAEDELLLLVFKALRDAWVELRKIQCREMGTPTWELRGMAREALPPDWREDAGKI